MIRFEFYLSDTMARNAVVLLAILLTMLPIVVYSEDDLVNAKSPGYNVLVWENACTDPDEDVCTCPYTDVCIWNDAFRGKSIVVGRGVTFDWYRKKNEHRPQSRFELKIYGKTTKVDTSTEQFTQEQSAFGSGWWRVEVWRDSSLANYFRVGETRNRNFYHYNNVTKTNNYRLEVFEYKLGARKVGVWAARNLTIWYETTKDYRINLLEYFQDLVGLPENHLKYTRTEEHRSQLYHQILNEFSGKKWDFIELESGVLTIKEGYRWDGTSRPKTEDVGVIDVRASCIHDAIYDLMRLDILDNDKGASNWSTNGYKNRLVADIMWYQLSIEDGRSALWALTNFTGLRVGGQPGTHEKKKLLPWKFHVSALTAWAGDGEVHLNYQPADFYKLDPKHYYEKDRRYEIFRTTSDSSTWTHIGSKLVVPGPDLPLSLPPEDGMVYFKDSDVVNGEIYYYWIRSNVYDFDTDHDSWTDQEETDYGNGYTDNYDLHPYYNEKHYDESNVEAAVPVSGSGNALQLNGVDQFVISTTEPGDEYGRDWTWTFEAWVYPEDLDSDSVILAVSGAEIHAPTSELSQYWPLTINSQNRQFCYDTWACSDSTQIVEGQWYHLAVTSNGVLYVNGKPERYFHASANPLLHPSYSIGASFEIDKELLTQDYATIDNTRVFGGWQYTIDSSNHFKGKIDEVRVWDVVRSQAQIQANMYQPVRGSDSRLKALWHFDEPDDTNTAFDATKNGNDGAVHNCKSWGIWGDNWDCFVPSGAMNMPPVADANGPYEAECTSPDGADVLLDGSGSYDPEGGELDYLWLVNGLHATGMTPTYLLPLGTHEVDLAVVDITGQEDSDETSATVIDTTAPVLTCPDNIIAECTGPDGAPVVFEAAADDLCDDDVTPFCDPEAGSTFPTGAISPVMCSAVDASANETQCNFTVEVRDTVAPVITGITEPLSIWKPNHKYQTFTIRDFVYSVTDTCTQLTLDDLLITQVTSNESSDSRGDGNTADDFVISPDRKSVDLRIERQGKGNGRLYTIDIQAVDGSGNLTTKSFQVRVNHSKKR